MVTRCHAHLFAKTIRFGSLAPVALALMFVAGPALAGEKEAEAALSRASVKIETVTPRAGQASQAGDQSFNMARERLNSAQTAEAAGRHDVAEMRANEASLLADLTGERAVLAALETSHRNLQNSAGSTPAQP
jgi:hypothetical protein